MSEVMCIFYLTGYILSLRSGEVHAGNKMLSEYLPSQNVLHVSVLHEK